MRVTGGSHRGRLLAAPPGGALRPSSDRLRQTLFNILGHGAYAGVLDGAVVLDAFAGTGALGIEALSRGAAHATFMERDRAALAVLRQNLDALGEGARATVLAADVTRPPPAPPGRAATLLLMDPPYGDGARDAALAALLTAGWLAPGALAVVEAGARDAVPTVPGFALIEERRVGDSRLIFLERA